MRLCPALPGIKTGFAAGAFYAGNVEFRQKTLGQRSNKLRLYMVYWRAGIRVGVEKGCGSGKGAIPFQPMAPFRTLRPEEALLKVNFKGPRSKPGGNQSGQA